MSAITIVAPPTTEDAASQLLATMAAESGVLTDYNIGSQVRTMAEAQGSVVEQQGIWSQALALQALAYSAMSLFGITPGQVTSAQVLLTFTTSLTLSPLPTATQNVSIPAGTIVQSGGGVQFSTNTSRILPRGSSSITVYATAIQPGTVGNVSAGSITSIVNGLTYPLFVTNAASASGGTNAEALTTTLARFASRVAAIGLSSPVAIANSAIGVMDPNTGRTVQYSTVWEPWTQVGFTSGLAGWQLYIDDGTGNAASGLINAVIQNLGGASGVSDPGTDLGYRDAGVPYEVLPVVPLYAVVSVSGVVGSGFSVPVVTSATQAAVSGYFTLPFGQGADQAQISAVVANASPGAFTSLTVLLYASGSSTPINILQPVAFARTILSQLNLNLT